MTDTMNTEPIPTVVLDFPIIRMGLGHVEVGNATHDGLPALWFGRDGRGLDAPVMDHNRPAHDGETLALFTFADIRGLDAIEAACARLRKDMGQDRAAIDTEPIPTVREALEALDSMDDYARMTVGVDARGPRECLRRFLEERAALDADAPLTTDFGSGDVYTSPPVQPLSDEQIVCCYPTGVSSHLIADNHWLLEFARNVLAEASPLKEPKT